MQGIERAGQNQQTNGAVLDVLRRGVASFPVERVGETLLLIMSGSFFTYLIIASLNWPLGAALMPRLVAAVGLFLLALRVVQLARNSGRSSGQIMDTGFASTDLGLSHVKRFTTVFGSLILLCLAIWLVGWHIALPAYVVLYLRFPGEVRWWVSLLVGAAFLALLVGVYDIVFQTPWNEPAILRLFS
jgi:hypothetical protein